MNVVRRDDSSDNGICQNPELVLELCDMKFFLCPMSWEFMSRYKLTYVLEQ